MKTSVVLFFVTVIACCVSTRNVKTARIFQKLTQYNAEFFSSLKCCDSCFKNGADCIDDTVKCFQYERAQYDNKGVTKKKIQLVEKFATLPEFIELLKIRLKHFPRHRFNASYTKTLWNHIYANLRENSIVKIQDFSQDYTCLPPPGNPEFTLDTKSMQKLPSGGITQSK